MLRLVLCEFWKLKRRKLCSLAFLTVFLMPLFYSFIMTDKSLDNLMSVVREENGFILLIPLSMVVTADLFFVEHDQDTLKNLLCIPVSKGQIALAKIFVLLCFDVAYELVGYAVSILLAVLLGIPLKDQGLQLFLTFCTGILLWAAALPGVLFVVWFNKSYIISVIFAFGYAILGYIMHISDACLRVPVGFNAATFLPVPMIFRWLYQYHAMEGAGEVMAAFYEGFRPYFVSTPVVFAVLLAEAAVSTAVMMVVYRRQDV